MTALKSNVSAIVICYNHERFVSQCLDSLLAQTQRPQQWIVIDDASTDRSREVIAEWLALSGVEAVAVFHVQNQGLCRSLNEALDLASCEYVSIVAADDRWLPRKLELMVSVMQQRGRCCAVVFSDALRINEAGDLMQHTFIESAGLRSVPEGSIRSMLLQRNFIPAMATLVRRECYDRVGKYDETLYVEDWDMWLRISAQYKFAYVSTPLAECRWVADSMSRGYPALMAIGLFLTVRKQIMTGGLDSHEKEVAVASLMHCAALMWESRARGYRKMLWIACLHRRRMGAMSMAVFASIGFSWAIWQRFMEFRHKTGSHEQ